MIYIINKRNIVIAIIMMTSTIVLPLASCVRSYRNQIVSQSSYNQMMVGKNSLEEISSNYINRSSDEVSSGIQSTPISQIKPQSSSHLLSTVNDISSEIQMKYSSKYSGTSNHTSSGVERVFPSITLFSADGLPFTLDNVNQDSINSTINIDNSIAHKTSVTIVINYSKNVDVSFLGSNALIKGSDSYTCYSEDTGISQSRLNDSYYWTSSNVKGFNKLAKVNGEATATFDIDTNCDCYGITLWCEDTTTPPPGFCNNYQYLYLYFHNTRDN